MLQQKFFSFQFVIHYTFSIHRGNNINNKCKKEQNGFTSTSIYRRYFAILKMSWSDLVC